MAATLVVMSLSPGCGGGTSDPNGTACKAPRALYYEAPGCGGSVKPVCDGPEFDASASQACGCDGKTINGGGGAYEEPFMHVGPCETSTPEASPCLRSSHGTGAPECADYELCVTHIPAISVNTDNCAPGACSWTFMPDAGDTLTYENEDGWIFLRFDDYGLGRVETTADLVAVFQHVNFYAKFPLRKSVSDAAYFEARTGPEAFDLFAIDGGRLHVKLTFTIGSPYIFVLSKTTFCGDTNSCMCSFADVGASTSFEIDLPFTRS